MQQVVGLANRVAKSTILPYIRSKFYISFDINVNKAVLIFYKNSIF